MAQWVWSHDFCPIDQHAESYGGSSWPESYCWVVVCLGSIRAGPARHRCPSRHCSSLPYAASMAAPIRLARNAAAVAIHGARPKTHHEPHLVSHVQTEPRWVWVGIGEML